MKTEEFYDNLTQYYDLVYVDWKKSIAKQAEQLNLLIRNRWDSKISSILDVSCGIGTQALGLSQLGYQVSGCDISEKEIQRASAEAKKRNLQISFYVADMRTIHDSLQAEYDCVISCDNSLPHLLSDEQILQAFRQMHKCVTPGAGCLISVRDYEKEIIKGKVYKPYGIREREGKTFQLSQVWDCDSPFYTVSMFVVEDNGGNDCKVHVSRSRYYAITISRLMKIMKEAGFGNVERIDDRYFQPILIGDKT